MKIENGELGQIPIIIRSSSGWVRFKLGDLWEYRELLYFLVWRDIKVRYKQTVLGIAWVVLQPSFITLAFGIFKRVSSAHPTIFIAGFNITS